MPREIKEGDSWFHTRSTEFASVLSALDFEFYDPELPCEVREIKGNNICVWMYEPNCKHGELTAGDVYKSWKKAEEYCEQNPRCRIAAAIATAKNLRLFNDETKKAVPSVCYEIGDKKIWVKKGSEQEIKLSKSSRANKL